MPADPPRTPPTELTANEVAEADGLEAWTFVLGFLQAEFRCPSFSSAADLMAATARAADEMDHHPDLDLRFPGVVLARLRTHTVGGVTNLDIDLARVMSALAADAGASVSDRAVQQLEIAFDTMDQERIRPFWAAALDYRDEERFDVLVDPRGQGPTIWFQQLDEPRSVRNRIHFDITVPPSEADARIEAAVAAGGTLVSAERARAFWVLADADGNEVCICTWQDRD